jgi:hypothetical protein
MTVVLPTRQFFPELLLRTKAVVIDSKPRAKERVVLIEPRMSHGLPKFVDENPRPAQKKLMRTIRPDDSRRIDDGLILAIFFAVVSQAQSKGGGLERLSYA